MIRSGHFATMQRTREVSVRCSADRKDMQGDYVSVPSGIIAAITPHVPVCGPPGLPVELSLWPLRPEGKLALRTILSHGIVQCDFVSDFETDRFPLIA